MSQSLAPSARYALVVRLAADDWLTDEQIAATVGMSRKTLTRWKRQPDFLADVARIREGLLDAAMEAGIADKRERVRAAHERWQAIKRIRAERAADPKMADVPGGRTGWIVREVKPAPGSRVGFVEVYTADTALMAEARATEKQVAQELGQWVDRSITLDIDVASLTDEELASIISDRRPAASRRRIGAPPPPEGEPGS